MLPFVVAFCASDLQCIEDLATRCKGFRGTEGLPWIWGRALRVQGLGFPQDGSWNIGILRLHTREVMLSVLISQRLMCQDAIPGLIYETQHPAP